MASRRLALVVLLGTLVAVQSQRQFPSSRFSTQRTSSSVSSQSSPRGRSAFSRTSVSSSSPGGRASTSSFASRRRLGSGASQATSQLSSRAGGFSSGRPSFSRSSVSSSSSSSSSRSSFGSRRKSSRPASKPASPFGSTRTSSSSSSSRSRLSTSSSPFSRQRVSTTTSGSRPTFGSTRRKTITSTRQSSSGSSSFSRGSTRGSSSAFNNRASTSTFARGSPSSRTRSQARPQAGSNAFRSGGSSRNTLLKQSPTVNFNCPDPDGFFADPSQCDKYFECKEGVARARTCPDGLLFHPERSYPCVYPVEATCETRSALQSPQPTEECPRQFATFKAAVDASCGAFTRCINGRAYPSGCPEGLAFDARTLGCEYADVVEDCDASAYLGFRCPAREFTPDQVGEFTREAHPSDCTKFYVCVNKEDGSVAPRLQGCPEPSVFDPVKGACNDQPEDVPGCENVIPEAVLAAYRQRSSEEQERRASRLAELRAKLTG